MQQLLSDLALYQNASLEQFVAEHYKIERILELLVVVANGLLVHLLAEQGVMAETYRDSFRLAGVHGIIPVELGARLQNAAGMRNILVHLYEEIDYTILHQSLKPTLQDFSNLFGPFTPYQIKRYKCYGFKEVTR